MIKHYCDKCNKEITDPDFRFEGILVELKQTLDPKLNSQSGMIKKSLHLCKDCYNKNIGL